MAFADEVQAAAELAAREVAPAVVGIGTRGPLGSGVVFADGLVLTCAHNVRFPGRSLHFADGRGAKAEEVHFDPALDLALVATDTAGLRAPRWAALPAGLGTPVLAVVNPGGDGVRITLGTLATPTGALDGGDGLPGTTGFEHSAPCPPGSSGAPLVTLQGQVVGFNVRRQGALYWALAATADLRGRLEALGRGEELAGRGWLGLVLYPAPMARRLRQAVGLEEAPGALVRDVLEDGPAARAGVRRGDLLVAAAGQEVSSPAELHQILVQTPPGTAVQLRVNRADGQVELTATVEQRPSPTAFGHHFRRGRRRG